MCRRMSEDILYARCGDKIRGEKAKKVLEIRLGPLMKRFVRGLFSYEGIGLFWILKTEETWYSKLVKEY